MNEMNTVRFITVDGSEEYAVVPIALWNSLVASVQHVIDARGLSSSSVIPARVRDDIAVGVHPLRAWRRHRRMTTAELAVAANVSASFVTLIETGKRNAKPRVLDRLAAALDAPVVVLEPIPAPHDREGRSATGGQ